MESRASLDGASIPRRRFHWDATRRLAGRDAARDAVGETFARAVAGIGTYRGDGAGVDAWLYGILRHVV
ncbi:MAG TPA: sigma factor, partial [Nitrospiraceae bacterium]|nr:sigma factor [Nitrospiraceae bacterium]